MRRQAAFTLVELVMVIALAGVVAVMISTVLVRPMQGLVDQSRRAELVDQAGLALSRMARQQAKARAPRPLLYHPGQRRASRSASQTSVPSRAR